MASAQLDIQKLSAEELVHYNALVALYEKRQTIRDKLSKIKLAHQQFAREEIDLYTFQAKCGLLERIKVQFDSIQQNVLENPLIVEDEEEEFEIEFMSIFRKLEAETRILSNNQAQQPPEEPRNVNPIPKLKLPEFQMPKFNGKIETFREFRDKYEALIHNTNIPTIEKLIFLLEACKDGDAKDVLSGYQVVEANYESAWEDLKKKFGDKRVVVDKHLSEMLKVRPMARENHIDLRKLITTYSVRLKQLKIEVPDPQELLDLMIVNLATWRLDEDSRKAWELNIQRNELPSWSKLEEFLEERCRVLEQMSANGRNYKPRFSGDAGKGQTTSNKQTTSLITSGAAKIYCRVCNEEHYTFKCKILEKKSPKERVTLLEEKNLCLNCLSPGHSAEACLSTRVCKECKMKHHSLVHQDETPPKSNPQQESSNETIKETSCNCSQQSNQQSQVFLATAVVEIEDSFGNPVKCRALLDNGSESCFITDKLASKLGLKRLKAQMKVVGLNQETVMVKSAVETTIRSTCTEYKEWMNFLIVPAIANNIPSHKVEIPSSTLLHGIRLADPKFYIPDKVDVIIGAAYFFDVIKTEKQILIPNQLSIKQTEFGYVVYGQISPKLGSVRCMMNLNEELLVQMKKFWEIESIETSSKYSEEEEKCERLFSTTTERDGDGRFVVRLPMKETASNLNNNKTTAIRRLIQLETRLEKNIDTRRMYKEFMHEYLNLGHMTEIDPLKPINHQTPYYLPHHPVLKMSSTTTKLRVVFNASSKTSSGRSLNDILCVGPVVQPDLLPTLLKFCQHEYACIADIKMMYRQIRVHQKDNCLQRIVYRDDTEDSIKQYELQTVTYGTAPASFLATRCLKQLSVEFQEVYPKAAEIIATNFYMDDLLTGFNNIEEAMEVQKQIIKILASAKFHLRKWMSNDERLLQNIHIDDRESVDIHNPKDFVRTLGLCWKPKTDKLGYIVQEVDQSPVVTKRSILSAISKWYDPMGRINPVILIGKLMIQKLWKLKTDWDQTVPLDIEEDWKKYRESFVKLADVEFDRCVLVPGAKIIEIHGFSDASESAYGACVYLKSENERGDVKIQLFCAKSKVAPIQHLTLPRLELLAAELLSQLWIVAKNALVFPLHRVVLWSDSTIVLCWLKMDPGKLKTFVRNRVQNIMRTTEGCVWRHVNSSNNPADHASRGLTPAQIVGNQIWWQGPQFLALPEESWPRNPINVPEEQIPEFRALLVVPKFEEPDILQNSSSIHKIKNIFGFVKRFLNNCRAVDKGCRQIGLLTPRERTDGLRLAIRCVQVQAFEREIRMLENKETLKGSQLAALNLFLGEDKLIRVGGRLKNSLLDDDQKHPILLPSKHQLTKLIILNIHQQNFHCGQSALLSFVRQKYWPLRGKTVVRSIIRNCILCSKLNPRPIVQFMGDLPECRVQLNAPFHSTGVDFAGPIWIKHGGPRSRVKTKAYIALFVCMATKAIHLECVSDLTREAFLASLDRFFARRGLAKHMYSDNGSNLISASSEIKEILRILTSNEFQADIKKNRNYDEIEWHPIPPRAPNFGGVWEAGVKSVKHLLVRVIGEQLLNFEELSTVLTRIEAILNSRPLTPESSDPNDLSVLTPGHFLIGRPLNARPQEDITEVPINRLHRWSLTQRISQDFWKRYHVEYLHHLQIRSKWFGEKIDVPLGALVTVKEDNLPPLKWSVGRIVELHPGKDNIVRVVTVKTKDGLYKRPVNKICVLPVEA